LGLIMLLRAFDYNIPEWLSPVATFLIVGFFFFKSVSVNKTTSAAK
jgi:hypothetical protein